jgi:hypothetical protein
VGDIPTRGVPEAKAAAGEAAAAAADTGIIVGTASALRGGRFMSEGERSRGDVPLAGLGLGDRVTFGAR